MSSRVLRACAPAAALGALLTGSGPASAQPYPASEVILDVTIETATHDRRAPGSDNWPMTWADDGHQYTSWGDGGGFDGTNTDGRVSLGVARVEGTGDSYTGFNVWGGKDPETPATFEGKSYGIISIGGVLYLWVSPGSSTQGYASQTLHTSSDHGLTWSAASWSFTQSDGVLHPTFLQFGQDYAGALDGYAYMYSVRIQDTSDLMVQTPGIIDLMRAPSSSLDDRSSYEFFAGLSGGSPTWTADIGARQPVFEDSEGVGWNVSASYNQPLRRVLLCTEHTATMQGNLGMFDAPAPWGPWTTVGYYQDWEGFGTTFFWNFANKWVSADGMDFTFVFTGIGGNDSWNTVRGSFDAVAPAAGGGGVGGGMAGAGGIGGGTAGTGGVGGSGAEP
ncbi:MAG: hypothetical protein JRI23_17550, partial [Deltaproteobacteria bacterium]|nr:hypothetical protein [Deltaproteobacteria bacterium]MBW2533627.1 hypothetical protein [Deltaproteobacteria bacterium]